MKLVIPVLVAACGSPAPAPSTPTQPARPVQPAAAPQPAPPPDVATAWKAAVAAHDAKAIESLLALPFTLYYDDGLSMRQHAECDPVRVVREVKTPAERTAVAACIAATVQFTAAHLEGGGVLEPVKVIPELPEEMHGTAKTLSSDHVFVRVPANMANDYDATFGVPKAGDSKARLVVLRTIRG